METIYAVINGDDTDGEKIRQAGEILKAGGLVAFPTETVYGLGGDALNPDSSRKIYMRPKDGLRIILLLCISADGRIFTGLRTLCLRRRSGCARRFGRGRLPYSSQKDTVPDETTGGLDTVAVRFPSHPVAQRLIDAAGGFVAAPSANASGKPSPTMAEYVAEDMNGRIEMILDGGAVGIGLESTIVDLTGGEPTVLRPGYVTQEMLEKKCWEMWPWIVPFWTGQRRNGRRRPE